jgi:hypothetical protein
MGKPDDVIYKSLRGLPELRDKSLVELVGEGVAGIWAQIARSLEDAGLQAQLMSEYAPIRAVTEEFEQAGEIDLNIARMLERGLAKWLTREGQLTHLRIDLPVDELKSIVPHKTKLEKLLDGFEAFKVNALKAAGVLKKEAMPAGGRIELIDGKFGVRTVERKKVERAARDPNAPRLAGPARGKRVVFAYGEEKVGEASLGRSGVNLCAAFAVARGIKKANGGGWTKYEQEGDSFNFVGNYAAILKGAGFTWAEVKE